MVDKCHTSGIRELGDPGSRLKIVVRRMDITLFVARSSTISVDDCFELIITLRLFA